MFASLVCMRLLMHICASQMHNAIAELVNIDFAGSHKLPIYTGKHKCLYMQAGEVGIRDQRSLKAFSNLLLFMYVLYVLVKT